MEISRRDLSGLLALLAAGTAEGKTKDALPSKCYSFEGLAANTDPKSGAESRQVFRGSTHNGVPIDLHITTMPPGQMPHPPHHHVHEEMFFVQQGFLEATINGDKSTVGPGSVIYIHSNDEHGVKSVGDVAAQYFVFAIGKLD